MLVEIDDQVTVESGSDYRDQVLTTTIEDIPFVKEMSVYTPLDDKGEIRKLDFDYAYNVAVVDAYGLADTVKTENAVERKPEGKLDDPDNDPSNVPYGYMDYSVQNRS